MRNELDLLPFEKLNDMDERTTPIQGGDYFHIEWDNNRSTHNTIGGIRVSLLHPRQVIPQAGVTDINDMDYIFILTGVTKEYVKRTYGIDSITESEGIPAGKEQRRDRRKRQPRIMVTLVTAYYKNDSGGIGVYRWVGDTEVQSLKDYFARRLRRCKKCAQTVSEDDKECPVCGAKPLSTRMKRQLSLTGR